MSVKSYIVAVATLLCPFFVLSIPLSSGGGGTINQLRLIGSVEGKSYFALGNTTATWLEARTFCNSSGLRLASITSVAQSTLLKNAFNSLTFTGAHWTGGRDSRKPSQFSWDHNDEVLNSTVTSPFGTVSELTCMYFHANDKSFFGYPCAYKFKILCELAPSQLKG